MRRALVVALTLAGCGDNSARGTPDAAASAEEVCAPPPGEAPWFDVDGEPCRYLSSYRFFRDGRPLAPRSARVARFELNTPLFSDHAGKHRFVWLPDGEAMGYADEGLLAMPVGTVIIKAFQFERLVETRLLVRGADGWRGLVYVWDEDETDAALQPVGGIVPVLWKDAQGDARPLDYIVPGVGQCTGCHVGEGAEPIGPQARHLHRDGQLAMLRDLGMLTGLPADPADIPRTPVWDDPETGTVEERARAWLDVNCAHCHSPTGPARASGLDLRTAQSEPSSIGVCKTTVAAGTGSGGLTYDIVPGDPDASILVHRLASTEPAVRMPELLRQTVHQPSLDLVREWIAAMDGSCDEPE